MKPLLAILIILSGVATSLRASEAGGDFWSFQPVAEPTVPTVQLKDWQINPIDAFILHRLQAEGLSPVAQATKRTLIRRVTFDLIGLPPRPEEIQAFLSDDQPDAFDRFVERLLSSRHYGERWGRHWLDLVRYADTAGDAADYPVPEAYKYRNYVIDAFNDDKPYDQFVREQIAGDLLPSADDADRWEKVIATGYVAISRRIGVSPFSLRHITLEDTLDNVGKTFMGLSIGCARCHDHKFDPISAEDYYALYGIFDSSIFPHAGAEHRPHRSDFVYRIGKPASDEKLKEHRAELDEWNKRERAQMEVYRSFQRMKVTDPTLSRASTWRDLLKIRADRAAVAKRFPDLEIAYALQDAPEPGDVHVMKAGNPSKGSRGQKVRRGFLQVLGGEKLPEDFKGSGRLQLADWLADKDNPLTARVMVNRVWQHHFGRGLVASSSDFGVRGDRPSHPLLLDFLAHWFVDHGWSIKKLHRLIIHSKTYQLSAQESSVNQSIDPTNRLLWRSNRQRLDAEQLRDSLLMASEDLDWSVGGRHPFPHRLTYFYRQHDPFQETYPTRRRSVYMMQQRIQKDPYLDTFDGPDGNQHYEKRRETITTLQALFMMNSEFIHERSEAIAKYMIQRHSQVSARVEWAYLTLFGRSPQREEIARAEDYLEEIRSQLNETVSGESVEMKAWAGYVRGMITSNEFMFID